MKGDFSRDTFDRDKGRTGVRLQQGRVLLDADWNEQLDLQRQLQREVFRDVVGTSGVPADAPDSFAVIAGGNTVTVRGGRIWVDGLLVESETDVALDMSSLPLRNYLVALEVWERLVTAVEDPSMLESALGGVDTAARTVVTSRLRVFPVDQSRCQDLGSLDFGRTTGAMAAQTLPPITQDDPCEVPSQSGYTGIDNCLYRIEIHRGGSTASASPPTFKWARDNASAVSVWLEKKADRLRIESLGRDTAGGFHEAKWVEIGYDELDLELEAPPARLIAVEAVESSEDGEGGFLVIDGQDSLSLPDPLNKTNPKVRLWNSGEIPITAHATVWQELGEHHLEVRFTPGEYRSGDYWLIPARAFVGQYLGSIEWPGNPPLALPPRGVRRSYARLGLIAPRGRGWIRIDDCRCIFPRLCQVAGGSGCAAITVSRSRGDVRTIAEAFAALPPEGGEIRISEGRWNESLNLSGKVNVVIRGCGKDRTFWVAQGADAALGITDSSFVEVRDLTFVCHDAPGVRVQRGREGIHLHHLAFEARHRCAVVAPAVTGLEIEYCQVRYIAPDSASLRNEPALFLGGRGLRLYRNHIQVEEIPAPITPYVPFPDQPTNIEAVVWRQYVRASLPGLAPGSVQIVGGSRDLELRENLVEGGAWHGVVLGSVRRAGRPFDWFFDQWIVDAGATTVSGPGFELLRAHFDLGAGNPEPFPLPGEGTTRFLDVEPLRTRDGLGLLSEGPVTDVRLIDNRIQKMGGCGISSAYFFRIEDTSTALIGVDDLLLDGNEIRACLRLQPFGEAFGRGAAVAFGAVALSRADRAVIRDNVFENNGLTWSSEPICGVFVECGTALRLAGNRIAENGSRPQAGVEIRDGRRGGVVIGLALVDTYQAELELAAAVPIFGLAATAVTSRQIYVPSRRGIGWRQDGKNAFTMHANEVVAPQGRALEVAAYGPVAITCNQLTTQGNVYLRTAFRARIGNNLLRTIGNTQAPGLSPEIVDTDLGIERAASVPIERRHVATLEDYRNSLGGAAVFVQNFGQSNEFYSQGLGYSGFGDAARLLDPNAPTLPTDEVRVLVDGNLLFNDNQVRLDGFSEGTNLLLSSVTLLTSSDLSCTGNQLDCDLPFGERVVTHGLFAGRSLRVCDNRFTEPLWSAEYSAFTFGVMNRTTDNQFTHCYRAIGAPHVSRDSPNEVMLDLYQIGEQSLCIRFYGRESAAAGAGADPAAATARPATGPEAVLSNAAFVGTDREALVRQLEAAPKVAQRLFLLGLDTVTAAMSASQARAGLALAASAEASRALQVTRFVEARGHLAESRKALGQKEQATGMIERGEILFTGRVIGGLEQDEVVLTRGNEAKNLASAKVIGGSYRIFVERQHFAEYFRGFESLSLNVRRPPGGLTVGGATQPVGNPNQLTRQIDIVLLEPQPVPAEPSNPPRVRPATTNLEPANPIRIDPADLGPAEPLPSTDRPKTSRKPKGGDAS